MGLVSRDDEVLATRGPGPSVCYLVGNLVCEEESSAQKYLSKPALHASVHRQLCGKSPACEATREGGA